MQRKFEKGSRAENLPGSRNLKLQKVAQKKQSKKKMEESGEVMGWAEISEEQDHANSDFEAMVLEQANERSGTQLEGPMGDSSLGSGAHDAAPASPMRRTFLTNSGREGQSLAAADSLADSTGQVAGDDPMDDDFEVQAVSAELIGASYALQEGDLEKYA